MKSRIVCFTIVLGLLYSCVPKLKVTAMQPDPVQVPPKLESPEATGSTAAVGPAVVDLEAAKVLYENKCNKCHGLYKPNDFTAEQWKPIMKRMQIKAKIDDAQREEIYAYIVSGMH